MLYRKLGGFNFFAIFLCLLSVFTWLLLEVFQYILYVSRILWLNDKLIKFDIAMSYYISLQFVEDRR